MILQIVVLIVIVRGGALVSRCLELVSGARELPDSGARNQTLISARVVWTPNHGPSPAPYSCSLEVSESKT